MTRVRYEDTDKALFTAGFVALFAALLVIARTPPVSGYELTIYHGYPAHFWVLFVGANMCGIGVILHQAFSSRESRWWLGGLLLVVFCNSVLIGLTYFRGYGFFWGGDSMAHVGMMRDIAETGHVGPANYYPALHVLGASLHQVAGLSYAAVNLIAALFFALYVFGMYLLATLVADRRGQAFLITALACPLVYAYLHTTIHPLMFSTFMLPLLLYFYHRRQQRPGEQLATVAPMVLLTLVVLAFHPVTGIFTVCLFLALALSPLLYRQIARWRDSVPSYGRLSVRDFLVPVTGLAVFLIWLLPHPLIRRRLAQVWFFSSGDAGTSVFAEMQGALGMAGLSMSETVTLFIARYGAIFIYAAIGGVAVLLVLRAIMRREVAPEPLPSVYASLFVVGLLASVFSFLGNTGEREPERIARFFLITTPVIGGLVFYRAIMAQSHSRLRSLRLGRKPLIIAAVSVILVVGVLGVFNAYHSPWVMNMNGQVTRMEIHGTAWFGNHRDSSIDLATGRIDSGLYDAFNFGINSAILPASMRYPPSIPSHFGYDEHNSIAEALGFKDTYLQTGERSRLSDRHVPESVRATVPLYPAEGFARLRADPAVAQIYTNGEFEVWRVFGKER